MSINAVIFDVYGTILYIPFEAVKKKAIEIRDRLKNEGYEVRATEIAKKFGKRWLEYSEGKFKDDYEFVNSALKDLFPKEELGEEFVKRFVTLGYIQVAETYPGVEETLSKLKEKGIKLGIISNSARSQTIINLKDTGIYDYFDVLYISSDFGIMKPDHRLFLKACEGLSVKPSETLVVGDRLSEDIAGAKQVEMKAALFLPTIEVKTWSTSGQIIKKTGMDMESEHQPDAIIKEIKEVLRIVEGL